MPSGPCKEFRMRTQRDKESKKSRGGENGKKQSGRRAVRSSIKVQLRNSFPVAAQWGMRLNSIWTCSGALLTSVWATARNKHVHKRTRACTCIHTHFPPKPLTMSAPPQGNQASGDRSALAHVYIHGLNLASFLSAAWKRNVFNLHNPHLACSPRRNTYRESRTKVRLSPLQHHLCVCKFVHVYVCVCVCVPRVNMHSKSVSVQRRK